MAADIDLLRDVLHRVRSVWGGSRELDCRLAYALGLEWKNPWLDEPSWRTHVEAHGYDCAWVTDHVLNNLRGVPYYSTSMDACFDLRWKLLPGHDYYKLDGDPSGFGAEVGNWFLTENEMHDYAKSEGASPELAFLGAILIAYIGRETNTGKIKSMG